MRPTPYLSVEVLPLNEKSCGEGENVFDWVGGDLWPRWPSVPRNLFPIGFIPRNFPAKGVVDSPVDPNPCFGRRDLEWGRLIGAFVETLDD